MQELAQYAARGLHSNNIAQMTRFLEEKYSLLLDQNAFALSLALEQPGNRHNRAERLDRTVLRVSLSAENRVRPFR